MNNNIYPLVSIVIPVFGVEKYIEKCSRSLFEQDYPDIEFIFVNDHTTDNSIKILESLIKEYPQREKDIYIINKQQNEGLPQARATGLKYCHGSYIIHVDSDDWVEPNYISSLVQKALESKAEIVWCDYLIETTTQSEQIINNYETDSQIEILKKLLTGEFHSAVWNKLISKNLYTPETEFTRFNQLEDLVLTTQHFLNAKKWAYVPRLLYHYRINNTSLSFSDKRIKKRCYEEYYNFKKVLHYLKKKNINLSELEPVLSNRINGLKMALLKYPENRNFEEIKSFYPESIKNLYSLHAPFLGKFKLYLFAKFNLKIIYKLLDYIHR